MFRAWLLLLSMSVGATEAPFWKSKEKAVERIQNGEILVAVTSNSPQKSSPKNHLRILGGGHVGAPVEFVVKQALDFENAAKISEHIKSAKYDAAARTLEIGVGAFGHTGKMKLAIATSPQDKPRSIEFTVIEGSMKGLKGKFDFAEVPGKSPQTEVGIDAEFRYDDFPVPKVFLEFGLEVVFQRMAGRLRGHVEEQYRKAGES